LPSGGRPNCFRCNYIMQTSIKQPEQHALRRGCSE
jgi:hypothetical protein